MSEQNKRQIETTTLNPVPQSERQSWINIALIQAGIMICVPSLMLGGLLAGMMDAKSAIISGTIGYLIAIIITFIMGVQGFDLGVPTCVAASSAFGEKGARILLSALFTLSLVGWFALQTNVCGSAFSNMMSTAFGMNVPIWASSLVWGIIMLITAVYGIDALKGLNTIAVPALVIVSSYGAYVALSTHGSAALFGYQPEVTYSILDGIALTISFLSVGMVLAADFTRYQRSRKDTFKSTFIGIFPSGLAMLIIGCVMSIITGNYDISMVLVELGIPILGMIVLILATWTTNTTNAYCAGIDIVMLLNLKDNKRAKATMAAGILGTLLAIVGAINFFESFLYWVGYTFTPVAGIMMADYYIIRKGNPKNWHPVKNVDWLAITSWILGILITTRVPSPLPIVTGLIASMLLFVLLKKLVPNTAINKESIDIE